eukprot:TRINITY_DN21070_c0_g1_i1.p1 TRINITY_DN21070_c0_g1~~TRINITY_DN21070_c0_g1_i1.p1  ORF type:complete len:354 (+),score=141.78 TRINITY_DN21070_c0_g1_i1:78-1139(+)
MSLHMFGMGVPPKDCNEIGARTMYVPQKDGGVVVRQLQKTDCSLLPVLTREPVGNLLEKSYRPKIKGEFTASGSLSPLTKRRLDIHDKRKEKEEEEKELRSVLLQHAARRMDDRTTRTMEVMEDVRLKEHRKEAERRRDREEQVMSKHMLMAEAELMKEEVVREKRAKLDKKFADHEDSKSGLKHLAAVREQQFQRKRQEEKNAVDVIATTLRNDYHSTAERRLNQQTSQNQQRNHELKTKEDSRRRARRAERRAEKKEARYVEMIGRRNDERQRQRQEEAVAILKYQQQQAKEQQELKRTLREEDMRSTFGNSLHPPLEAPRRQARPMQLFSAPQVYRDHHGRTLYTWGTVS